MVARLKLKTANVNVLLGGPALNAVRLISTNKENILLSIVFATQIFYNFVQLITLSFRTLKLFYIFLFLKLCINKCFV